MAWLNWGDKTAAVRKLAAALSQKYKITIDFHYGGETSHASPKDKKISINLDTIYRQGEDYTTGLILHEVAHVRHSLPEIPVAKPENPKISKEVYNWLEDRRIDSLMAQEYAGASEFQAALHDPELEKIHSALERNADGTAAPPIYAALAIATLNVEGYDIKHASTGNDYMIGNTLSELAKIYKKISGKSTHEEVLQATKEALNWLEPLPVEPPKSKQQGEGEEEGEHHPSIFKHATGYGTVQGGRETGKDKRYTTENKKADTLVEALKRKLIAKLRDTERERWQGNKIKGRLDKKLLIRTAHQNYRVYKKRVEPKGKKYAFAVALDCSGSMFGNDTIELAIQSAATLIRSTRGLGFTSSLVIFGHYAKTVLYPKDRYAVDDIQYRISTSGANYYNSGGNEVHHAIKESLASLLKQSGEKVLVIITDGGLDSYDVEKSKELIENAKKKGVHTIIYYVNAPRHRVLEDTIREHTIKNAQELIPATIKLLQGLQV